MTTSKQLSAHQLRAFDYDTVERYGLSTSLHTLLVNRPRLDHFTFVDIGGGNGNFTDFLLKEFPNSTGTLIDASEEMLALNSQSDRKTLLRLDALSLANLPHKYDYVFCNLVLHHLVTNTWAGTRATQLRFLRSTRTLLATDGRLVITEELKNGFIDGLPSLLIFYLTSSRLLAPIMRRFGANTAGVGVAFFSRKQLTHLLIKAGFSPVQYMPRIETPPLIHRILLAIHTNECGAMLLASPDPG